MQDLLPARLPVAGDEVRARRRVGLAGRRPASVDPYTRLRAVRTPHRRRRPRDARGLRPRFDRRPLRAASRGGLRSDRTLDIPAGLSEMELVRPTWLPSPHATAGGRPGVLRRGRRLRPLRPERRVGARRPLRALHVLHAVPAGAVPGRAAGPLRVSSRWSATSRRSRCRTRRCTTARPRSSRPCTWPAPRRADRVSWSPAAVDPRYVRDAPRRTDAASGYVPEMLAHPRWPDVGTGGARSTDVAAVVVQHPNVFGNLEPARELFARRPAPPGRMPSRSSTRCRSACSRRRASSGPTSRSPRARVSGTTSTTVARTSGCSPRRMERRSPDARAHRRRDGRRRRPRRLRAHAAGARAAHPPREGDLEHLHEPDADGDRRDRLPGVARARGPGGARPAVRGEGPLRAPSADGVPSGGRAAFPGEPFFKEFAVRCRTRPREVQRRARRSRVPRRRPSSVGGRRRPDRRASPSAGRARRSTRSRRRSRRSSRRESGAARPDVRAPPSADGDRSRTLARAGAAGVELPGARRPEPSEIPAEHRAPAAARPPGDRGARSRPALHARCRRSTTASTPASIRSARAR